LAVLPFENLNDQKNNSVFADGVQTTFYQAGEDRRPESHQPDQRDGYRGKRNVRQIGDALRVSHVLEGAHAGAVSDSLECAVDRHAHRHPRWAEDTTAILNDCSQSKLRSRKKFAERLHAKLSANEKGVH